MRKQNPSIQNIVFDLGGVLLDWHPAQISANFSREPEQQELILKQVFLHQDWQRLDRGDINELQAIDCFSRNTGLAGEQIKSLMQLVKDSLTAKAETVALLEAYKAKGLRLFCLSNICMEIFACVRQRHSFFNHFDGIVLSAQVKLAKPDPEIFRHLFEHFKLHPHQSLFIDDMEANTQAAANLGMQAVRFESAGQCERAIEKLLR